MSILYKPTGDIWRRIMATELTLTPEGCWLWNGTLNSSGYGCIGSGKRSRTALVHHVAVLASGREIPDGMTVDHQCHDSYTCPGDPCLHKRCVNPAHLVVMSLADNNRRKWERGLCRKGHPLTPRRDGRSRECVTCKGAYAARWRAARALPSIQPAPAPALALTDRHAS